MARNIRNPKLDSPTARTRLGVRREPYWVKIAKGCALGYRRIGVGRGTWIGKYRDESGVRHYEALGPADDALDADGVNAFSFAQAQEKARGFFARKAREIAGDPIANQERYTVADALRDYFAARDRWGHKAVAHDRRSTNALILPVLGDVPVTKLTRKRLQGWLDQIASTPARLRSRQGSETRFRAWMDTDEEKRRRRSTANRVWGTFRAALNFAAREHRITDEAWRAVRPFREVAAARLRYLSEDEARRLINACASDFRPLVTAALLTGCRYGELCRLTVKDFHPDAGTVFVRTSKSGKPRHIVLTVEGQLFFARLVMNRPLDSPLLTRAGERPWRPSHQRRPMQAACKAARIADANFHALRHTYASWLVMKGVPVTVVAAQLGHASIKMVEKHYGHLGPSYVADTVRAAFSELGVLNPAENAVEIKVPA